MSTVIASTANKQRADRLLRLWPSEQSIVALKVNWLLKAGVEEAACYRVIASWLLSYIRRNSFRLRAGSRRATHLGWHIGCWQLGLAYLRSLVGKQKIVESPFRLDERMFDCFWVNRHYAVSLCRGHSSAPDRNSSYETSLS